jgi:phage-related protein
MRDERMPAGAAPSSINRRHRLTPLTERGEVYMDYIPINVKQSFSWRAPAKPEANIQEWWLWVPAFAGTTIAALYPFCYIAKMRWTFRTLNAQVDDEVRNLPPDMVARFLRYGDIIEQAGLEALPRDAVKHLEGKLWELRITGRDGISRAIYVTASGRRVVVVRVFIKKTQKTPPRELEIARQRAREVE